MPGQDPVAEPGREALDLRLDTVDVAVALGRPVGVLRAVRVGPGGVPARPGPARGRGGSAGRAAGTGARAGRPGVDVAPGPRPRRRRRAPCPRRRGLGRGPRDRPVERPVDLQRRGPGAEAAQRGGVRAAERVAGQRQQRRGVVSATTSVAPTRSPSAVATPVTRPRSTATRVTRAPLRTSPPSSRRRADERLGQPLRRRPPGSASRRRGRGGSRYMAAMALPGAVRRHVAVHRRAVEPRARAPVAEELVRPARGRASSSRRANSSARTPPRARGARPARAPAGSRTASCARRAPKRRSQGPAKPRHAAPSPGVQGVERGRGALEVAEERGRAAVRRAGARSRPPGGPTAARGARGPSARTPATRRAAG